MAPPQLFIKSKAMEKQLEDKEDVHVPEKKQEGNKEDVPEKKKEGNKEDVHEKKKEREAGMRDLVCMILVFVGLIMVIGGVSFNKNYLSAKKSKKEIKSGFPVAWSFCQHQQVLLCAWSSLVLNWPWVVLHWPSPSPPS